MRKAGEFWVQHYREQPQNMNATKLHMVGNFEMYGIYRRMEVRQYLCTDMRNQRAT